MADETLIQFIEQARQGSSAAVANLYDRHHLTIFRYLYYRTGDVHTAEDLTSEVFIRMIRHIAAYQQQDVPFTAWLFQIARNLVIDHYRKTNAYQSVALDDTLPARADPVHAVDRRLDHQSLTSALKRISDEQRDVVILRFLAGLPIAEVASALGKSENAIKGLQRRGLIGLREALQQQEIPNV